MKSRLIPSLIEFILLASLTLLCVACQSAPPSVTEATACPHSFSPWEITVEPTCTAEGSQTRACTQCNYTETQSVPPNGHTEIIDAPVDATCTTEGSTEGSHCSTCNSILRPRESLPLLPHSFQEPVITEATCQQNGIKEFTCEHCPYTYTEEILYPSYSPEQIFEMAKQSVGEVIVYNKIGGELRRGSCIVYSSSGKIITTYAVIEDGYSAKIILQGQEYPVTRILSYRKESNLAVLEIKASALSKLNLCYRSHANGTPILAVGYGQDQAFTMLQGSITQTMSEIADLYSLHHDLNLPDAFSGGPLIDLHGEIIGFLTQSDDPTGGMAIHAHEIEELSYEDSLTFEEFYTKESDTFNTLKKYVSANGIKDPFDGSYSLVLREVFEYNDPTEYIYSATYNPEYNEVDLLLTVDQQATVAITIDQIDGKYQWYYLDSITDGYMLGTISASSFRSTSVLYYSEHSFHTLDMAAAVQEKATALMQLLCIYMDTYLHDMGLTADAIGFTHY